MGVRRMGGNASCMFVHWRDGRTGALRETYFGKLGRLERLHVPLSSGHCDDSCLCERFDRIRALTTAKEIIV